ncbi:MAG: peptidylprolyl isomerase [Candidatus Tectomicrobia bacterium]|nr:peptidylprolyl isomerase [Candidatus Tectomicrobia bacterium]
MRPSAAVNPEFYRGRDTMGDNMRQPDRNEVRRGPRALLAVVSCLAVFLCRPAGWAQEAQTLDGIAAVVNEEIITIGEVREAMAQRYRGEDVRERISEAYRETLRNLTDIQLQLARARQLQMAVSDDETERQIDALLIQNQISREQLEQLLKSRGMSLDTYRQQIREGLLVTKVINAEVRSRLIILDSELQEAYQARRDTYRIPGTQTVSHILFLLAARSSEEEVARRRVEAEGVLQAIRDGGDFAALARRHSEGPSAERGGLLGTFQADELLPGFEEAMAELQPGEVSGVVRTRVGLHIIRLEDRQIDSFRSLEEVREELQNELLRERTDAKYQEWLEALRLQAYVKILYED